LDARVHSAVMGHPWPCMSADFGPFEKRDHTIAHFCRECDQPRGSHGGFSHYSTDISAAWQVVEKLTAGGLSVSVVNECHPGQWCVLVIDDGCVYDSSTADTAPFAICMAALKAVGS
jgi:hypothetical protein